MYRAHIAVDPHTSTSRCQTCTEHAHSVAQIAKARLSPLGLSSTGELAGLLHDLGKFTKEFDAYLDKASRGEKVTKGSVIHTFAGVRYILEHFHVRNDNSIFGGLVAELIAVTIGSHHGLFDVWDERHRNGFEHRLTHQPAYDRQAIEAFLAECASPDMLEAMFRQAEQEIGRFYTDLCRNCARSIEEAHFSLSLLARLLTSVVVDADRTDTRCFMEGIPLPEAASLPWDACVEQLDAHIAGFPKSSPIQQARGIFSDSCNAAADTVPGLYRLDLPTGGGKTLAALRFATQHAQKHHMRRIFYIAPLLSIIEQNAAVIRNAVGNTIPVLEHHSNIIREQVSADEAARTEYLQETWDASMIVTTLVQLLETLFSGKMASVRRFHCLCNSIILIDEVQSLPSKMLSLFNCTINFLTTCCGTTVVLCSATQPAFDNDAVQHKMLPSTRLISTALYNQYAPLFQRTQITDGGSCSLDELAAFAVSSVEACRSLLIVCNTKREASQLYERLTTLSDVPLFHLSAGMCMAHRKQVLNEMTNALQIREPLICVSTQVIEAGIDISFGSVIRLSAGLDNIVQAAGRCNRHGEHSTPQPVRIVRLKDEKLGPLREIAEAQTALNSLLEGYRRDPAHYCHDLTSDIAVQDYYAYLYMNMPIGYQDYYTHGHTLLELLTGNDQYISDVGTPYLLNQAFRTAGEWFEVFDNASEGVLVPYDEGKSLITLLEETDCRYDIGRTRALLTQAKPYTVSVSSRQIERMLKSGMLCTLLNGSIYALNNGFYDDHTGIKEEDDSCSTLIL